MANNTEGQLIDLWKEEDKRTLLDIATGGKYKTSKDLPTLPEVYEGMSEYQEREMGKEVIPGLTQGELYGTVMGSVAGWSNNPTQYGRVLSAIPKRLQESFGAFKEAMKDPGKLIKSINRKLTNKRGGPEGRYDEKFIKEVMDDYSDAQRANIKLAKGKPKPTPGPQMGGQQIPPGGRRGAGPNVIETLF